MKLTHIEKIMLWYMLILFVISVLFNIFIFKEIESHGGVKQIIIDTGKAAKEINKEINKD